MKKIRINLHDFEQKKVIGKGHFGVVQVVREKQTGHVYALKTIRKSETLTQQHVAFFEEERDIMAKATSPWITHLQYAFQVNFHVTQRHTEFLGNKAGAFHKYSKYCFYFVIHSSICNF